MRVWMCEKYVNVFWRTELLSIIEHIILHIVSMSSVSTANLKKGAIGTHVVCVCKGIFTFVWMDDENDCKQKEKGQREAFFFRFSVSHEGIFVKSE